MANGDRKYVIPAIAGNGFVVVYDLLDAQDSADDGVWCAVAGAVAGSVHIEGLGASDGVTLFNHVRDDKDTVPTNSDDHDQIGSEITADGGYTLSESELACTDIKCKKTTATTADPTTVKLVLRFNQG